MKKKLSTTIKIPLLILFITTNFLVNRSAQAMYPEITYDKISYLETPMTNPSGCTKTIISNPVDFYSQGEKSAFRAYLERVKSGIARSAEIIAYSLFWRTGYEYDKPICYEVSTNKNAYDISQYTIQEKGYYRLNLQPDSFENTVMYVHLIKNKQLILSTRTDYELTSIYTFDGGDEIALLLDFRSRELNMEAKGSCCVKIERILQNEIDRIH